MSRNVLLIFLFSLLVVIILVSSTSLLAIYTNNRSGYVSASQILALQEENNLTSVDKSSNHIYVNNSSTIFIEQSPGMEIMNSTPSEYFLIDGLVNPTIVLKSGISVMFVIVNMDNMEHNFAITTIKPPYSYMIMGPEMMNNGGNFLLITHYLSPYTGGNQYPYEEVYFSANVPGDFWYLCTYPGHAEEGMYGQIIVNGS